MKADIDFGLIVLYVFMYWFNMYLLSNDSMLDLET